MTTRTNNDRARAANNALVRYTIENNGGEDFQGYHISDLLCDLHHLADHRNEDWGALLEAANGHYLAETTRGES